MRLPNPGEYKPCAPQLDDRAFNVVDAEQVASLYVSRYVSSSRRATRLAVTKRKREPEGRERNAQSDECQVGNEGHLHPQLLRSDNHCRSCREPVGDARRKVCSSGVALENLAKSDPNQMSDRHDTPRDNQSGQEHQCIVDESGCRAYTQHTQRKRHRCPDNRP